MRLKTFLQDEKILSEGELLNGRAYLIRSGTATITKKELSVESVIEEISEQAWFGGEVLFLGTERNVSVLAKTNLECYEFDREDLLDFITHEPEAARSLVLTAIKHFRAEAIPQVEVIVNDTGEGEHKVTLLHPTTQQYYRLSEEDYFIWQHLTGRYSQDQIVHFFRERFGRQDPAAVNQTIKELGRAGFLKVSCTIQRKEKSPWWTRFVLKVNEVMDWRMVHYDVNHLFNKIYQRGGYRLFEPHSFKLMGWFFIFGFLSFLWNTNEAVLGFHHLHEYTFFSISLIVVLCLSMVVHESGHALATKAIGKRVRALGFGLYWFFPMAFVDTTDAWVANRRARILVNLGGVTADLALASLLGFATILTGPTPLGAWLWAIAFVIYIDIIANLSPLMDLDGYYVMMDHYDNPNLRECAMWWLSEEFPHIAKNVGTEWRALLCEESAYWACCIGYTLFYIAFIVILQHFVILPLLPKELVGFEMSHFQWILPLFVLGFTGLTIYAQFCQLKHEEYEENWFKV